MKKMRNFKPRLYKDLFDEWDDPVIQAHMADECKLIDLIKNKAGKAFIDLGAGHGRILPKIASLGKNVISIEINPEMFEILKVKSSRFKNSTAVLGDMTKLESILRKLSISKPVLLLLQNTLGTIEGDYSRVLSQIAKIARQYHGEVVISLYRQQALKDWGLMSYYHGQEMNGEPDLTKTYFAKGIFISKTGYTSKWWTDKEIEKIKTLLQGRLSEEIVTDTYWIFHLVY